MKRNWVRIITGAVLIAMGVVITLFPGSGVSGDAKVISITIFFCLGALIFSLGFDHR